MVYFEFIENVRQHLRINPLLYGLTIDAQSMVDGAYWSELDSEERALIGPCLLILIGTGDIQMRKENFDVPKI